MVNSFRDAAAELLQQASQEAGDLKNTSKKCLTNKAKSATINKLSRENEHDKIPKKTGSRTLKIKQYRKSLKDL